MDSAIIFLIFFLAGAAAAYALRWAKFAIFAGLVTMAYFIHGLLTAPSITFVVLHVLGVFVSIQLGYVAGVALRAFWFNHAPKYSFPFIAIRKK